MGLILLEALLAGCVFIFIVWWTMFSGRPGGEPPRDVDLDVDKDSDAAAAAAAAAAVNAAEHSSQQHKTDTINEHQPPR